MKKRVLILALSAILLLASCGPQYITEKYPQSKTFILVEQARDWKTVYHKDTKVMYVISSGVYTNSATFTLLVNPDGTPMIYKEEK